MLSKSFKAGKCKTSVKLAAARIKLLRNKRDVQVKHMRRELAQLLESGQEQTARIRVEHVIREEKTMSAYDLIELYCELIAARLPIIESQKTCPIDLKEAVASVIFASPRCADIPELMDIRKHFTAKYGKEFINSALEVRPNCGVSRLVVEKLSARAPDVEMKIKILTSIAQEHNVKWDSKAFEEQLRKPNDDLLNGPSTFSGASKIPMESSSVSYSSAINQRKESSMPPNDAVVKPAVVSTFSYTNSQTSSTAVPFSSQPESRPSESISGGGVEKSYSREENASSNRPTRKMEFKDATSAAQAAAESAERASMAARAAAELATRENLSRENSFGSTTNRVNNERTDITRGSKLQGDHVEDSLYRHDEINRSQGMKPEIQNLRSEEVNQGVSRREAGKTKEDFSNAGRAASRSSSRSRQTYVSDGLSNVGPQRTNVKDYGHASRMSSESEAIENNQESVKHENAEYGQAYFVNYTESATSPDASTFSDQSVRHPRFENDVAFDDYGSDVDYIGSAVGSNKEHVLDSLFLHRGEEYSVSQSNTGLLSPRQHKSGSPSKISSSRLHLFTDSEEYSGNMTKVALPSQSEENAPAMFDDSDGLSSESEDEKDNTTHIKPMRPSNLVNDQWNSGESFPEESGCGLNNIYLNEKKEVEDIADRISDGYKENHERESYTADILWKRTSSSSSPHNQPSSRDDKSPSNSYDLRSGDSSSDEDTVVLHSSNVRPVKRSEAKEQLQMPSSPLRINDSEMSNKLSDESGPGLNYGRLTGGLKNRGFARPPYVRNSAINDSYSSKQPSGETSSISENPPTDSEVEKLSAGLDVLDQEFVNQDLHPRASMHKSRTSEAPKDSYSKLYHEEPRTKTSKPSSRRPVTNFDFDDGELQLDSDFSSENKPIREVKLSRRTRGTPTEGENNALKFTARSDANLTSEMERKSSEGSSAALEPHNNTVHDAININRKGSSKFLQSNLPAEHPSLAPRQISSTHEESPKSLHPSSTERFAYDGNTISNSTSGSASHENSVKSTHTHPKLPDYENLAAHFRSLRSNRN